MYKANDFSFGGPSLSSFRPGSTDLLGILGEDSPVSAFSGAAGDWNMASGILPGDQPDFGLGRGSGMGGYNGLDLGFNLPTARLALAGLGTIGNLWAAFSQLGLAKKQFKFQKDFANKNLENQTKSYNTRLYDRARSRYHTEGRPQDAEGYVSANRLDYKPL